MSEIWSQTRFGILQANRNHCKWCDEDHFSKDCQNKKIFGKHKCTNCSQSPRHKRTSNPTSTDPHCPFVIRERELVVRRTAGLDSKNLYLQKFINQRRI